MKPKASNVIPVSRETFQSRARPTREIRTSREEGTASSPARDLHGQPERYSLSRHVPRAAADKPRSWDRYVNQDKGKSASAFESERHWRSQNSPVRSSATTQHRGSGQVRASAPGMHLRPNGFIRNQVDGMAHVNTLAREEAVWSRELRRAVREKVRPEKEREERSPDRER